MTRNTPLSVSTDAQNLATNARLRIPGTDLNLEYRSMRQQGNIRDATIDVGLNPLSSGLLGHVVQIDVAGQHHEVELDSTERSYIFQWNGEDGQGRPVQGSEWATVRVGAQYTPVYSDPTPAGVQPGGGGGAGEGLRQSFGRRGSLEVTYGEGREPITVWRTYQVELRYDRPTELGFGGWTATLQRDPVWVDEQGQGGVSGVVENVFSDAAPEIASGFNRDSMAFGPDGTLYIGDFSTVFAVDRTYALEKTTDPSTTVTEDSSFVSTVVDSRDPIEEIRRIAVGPSGSIYAADPAAYAVFRIDPDSGSVTRIAGDGTKPTNSDLNFNDIGANEDMGEATETAIRPIDVGVGPEGSVYFVDAFDGFDGYEGQAVRRVTQNGKIEPVAGAPVDSSLNVSIGPKNDGTFDTAPTDVEFQNIDSLAVDGEGTVYVANDTDGIGAYYNVLSVESDGVLRLVTGDIDDTVSSPAVDGTEARDAGFGHICDLAVDEVGNLLVADLSTEVVQRVAPDGTVRRLFGTGDSQDDPLESGDPAAGGFGQLDDTDVAVAPDGTFVLTTTGDLGALARVRFAVDDSGLFPNPDGRIAARIPERHEETVNTLTGGTLWDLGYDDEGRVEAFVDAYGNETTVERTADGRLAAIESPTGQRTTFETDANGYLSTVTLPDGRQIALDFTELGLLTRAEDPADNENTFSYGKAGRLTDRTDPTGATTSFVRSTISDGARIKRISPEMREVTHTSEWDDGDRLFTTECCGGTSSSTRLTTGEQWKVTRRDGGSRTLSQGPDPRFGMAAPVTEKAVEVSPSGRETVTKTDRTVSLADDSDSLSLDSLTETVTINGRTFDRTFEAATNEYSITTPEGRSTVLTLDDNGDVSELSADGVDPVSIERNGNGRISERKQAGTVFKFEYDTNGYLEAAEDETGRRVEFDRDVLGRIQTATTAAGSADAATEAFEYDDAGNLTEFERPNGDVHRFSHDAAGRLTGYEPPELPDGEGVSMSYDGDGLLTDLDPASGRTMTNSYDTGGRRTGTTPGASGSGLPSVSYDWNAAGRVDTLTWSPDGGTDQTVSFDRDGMATTGLEYGGAVSGRFEYSHDDDGFVTGITFPEDVGSSQTHSLSHDDDGLTTEYGPFTLTRDGPDGAPTTITDGTLTITITYDSRGRVDTRTHEVGGTAIYAADYTYDDAGRIETRTETVDGSQLTTETFSYDEAGRLAGRTLGHGPDESYDYDANGNRVSRTLGPATLDATYRTGDRLKACEKESSGSRTTVAYSYDKDGFLSGRGSDTFSYSPKGHLLTATPNGGSTVTYTNDAHGRLIGRTVSGNTTEYLYGDPNRPWQLTVARDPDGTRTRYYYDPSGRLIAFDRDGTWHYVATDQAGSPRVVAATDGTVEKEIVRDSFGAVQNDSAPGFRLHVGFGGGVRDPDTGLVRFGLRDYEPETGRFTARDPILQAGGQYNFYAYAHSDPVNALDRSGLSCYWEDVNEDYNMTMDNISPVRNAIDEISGDVTAPQGNTEETLKNGAKTALKEGAKEGIEQLGKGASRSAAASAAATTGATAGATAVGQAAALEISLRGSIYGTSMLSNLSDISVTDGIASTLFEADPLGLQTVDDPENPFIGPGSGDCGSKSPDNC
ncbi:hypothetical protein KY092_05590 [Natronomonas gomsonensis]|uniref:RHS repeat-associated core domain-containing protein n=1 Tax=Natronomonas gomsonensis TaxID=1046043 RepID=UPI0020CA418B|nr:RHS repeat-associated core domain-containing protein [Natronomonas gomsonensis]MCY4730030.1 hypothetical protein [Natronomonas gomsonensis]